MVLLRSSAFNMQSLRYHHVVAGRMLHVKVFGKGLGWVEIVNTYQYAWGSQTDHAATEAKRAVIWDFGPDTSRQHPGDVWRF